VHSFLEKYKEAVSDYLAAHQIDPTLNANKCVDNIRSFVIKTASQINKKANLKQAKISEIAKSVPTSFIPIKGEKPEEKPLTVTNFESLASGKNIGFVTPCKVLTSIDKPMSVPLYFSITI
jgi:hypothetical protein